MSGAPRGAPFIFGLAQDPLESIAIIFVDVDIDIDIDRLDTCGQCTYKKFHVKPFVLAELYILWYQYL